MEQAESRGGAREKNGRFYANTRYGRGKRLEVRVPWAKSLEDAEGRAKIIGEAAASLASIGRRDLVKNTAKQIAEAPTEARLERVQSAIAKIVKGGKLVGATADTTLEEWANRYTSGELARLYPDTVKARNHKNDVSRLREYILPLIGDVPVVSFDYAHAQLVMSKLPPMSEANRRQIAQIMGRLMHLAVLPGRLITASPLPRGWLPKITKRKHYSCLFPREEAQFLEHEETSAAFRLFVGILDREGMRLSELLDSDWWQWNLREGAFQATKTKTGDPRFWACRPDTIEAMRIWKKRSGVKKPFEYVLELVRSKSGKNKGQPDKTKLAGLFRRELQAAGINRHELFESTEHTGKLRLHDMRATFVTVSLAEGKSDTWIRDRTAHKSTSMIDRYRRTARQFAELKLGSLVDLVEGLGWRKGGGKALSEDVPEEDLTPRSAPGGNRTPMPSRAVEPKFSPPSPSDATSMETPVETDVPRRCEPTVHQSSTTPIASTDAAGGGTALELDSSTPLGRVVEGLAVQRATWDQFDELVARIDVEARGVLLSDRDLKPENVRKPPAKAKKREGAAKRRRAS